MVEASTKDRVINELNSYSQKKRQASLLRFEFEHPASISEHEIIESMALTRAASETTHPGISNRTLAIALQFQDAAQRLNEEVRMQIYQELYAIETELHRIEFYVSQLEEPRRIVIQRYYLEEKAWSEIEKELHITKRALAKRRTEAIRELAEMFDLMEKVKGVHNDDN